MKTIQVDLETLKSLAKQAESYPYIDPDFNILIVEEALVPFMVMSKESFIKLEKKIIGA